MNHERSGSILAPGTRAHRVVPGLLLFAPLCLLCNAFGPVFRYPEIGSAVFFPPYAVLVAALVVATRRDWIWYILVAAAAHLATNWPQWPLTWVLLADVANVARALTAAVLLRWVSTSPIRIDGVDALAGFLIPAAIVAPAVGATIGAASVVVHDAATSYWMPWRAWFMSNALTGLTMLPAMVLVADRLTSGDHRRLAPRRVAEGIAIAIALTVSTGVAFLIRTTSQWELVLIPYVPIPMLIVAALRFGISGASVAVSAVTAIALWAAGRGSGPFLSASSDDNMLLLQLFVLLTTVPVLCIAAVSSGRNGVVQLHRALLASLRDHVAILDAHGVVVEANGSWQRFAGEPSTLPFHTVRPGDNFVSACRATTARGHLGAVRALEAVTSVLARGQQHCEIEYDDATASHHPRYALSVEALERADGGAVVTRSDVTARHDAQMKIAEQQRELAHLSRVAALGEMSGALAHELNQPLASISSNAEAARILLRRHPTDTAELDEILRDIFAEDQRAAQVIRRLRALLKRGETNLQPVDTNELVSDVLDLAHSELIRRRVSVTSVIAPNLPPVLGDRVQLQQVLLNLILNACEAMRSLDTRDRRLLIIARPDDGDRVQFSVRDCGSGIPTDLIERLFEPFVTTKPDGLGLGLSISRTIVAAHGGRLWAENNPEAGATLHCTLALASAVGALPTTQLATQ